MLESKTYVAIQDFSINLDNGKTTQEVKRGDIIQFDGLNVEVKGNKGQARSLARTIGEWIIEDSSSRQSLPKAKPHLARSTSNATGGKIVEHSDIPSEPGSRKVTPKDPRDDLEELVRKSENSTDTKITSDMDDIKKEVTIINNDADEVRKVTARDAAQVVNKESVSINDTDNHKIPVVSMEERVVKKTSYSGDVSAESSHKKLELDYESGGVEVRKTSSTNRTASGSQKASKVMYEDQKEVARTTAPVIKRTDVGSSTQVQIEQKKDSAKKSPTKKPSSTKKKPSSVSQSKVALEVPAAESAPPLPKKTEAGPVKPMGPIVNSDGQEAVIIRKVSKIQNENVSTKEGITSKVTVGAVGDMDVGDVEFSSNADIDVPEATVSSGEPTAVDMGSDDIDVNDILSEIE